MAHLLSLIADFPHEMLHRLRCYLSPAYADMAALVRDEDAREFLRECAANDWAADLRTRGYDIPVGAVLFGIRVTR